MPDLLDDLRTSLSSSYQIEREVGRGGMAIIYSAREVKHGRRVALKVLRPELAASLAADRFLREIRIAARLNHPHILPLYDSGRAGDHLYYIAPFAEGETLRARLERVGRLNPDVAVAIARDVANALACSHANGVIHRDIKPENILLNGNEAIVADFGIAHAMQEAGEQRLTQTGWALGTALYTAPEQALGQVDSRSDIYSLGCVMYEMLGGEPPFRGISPGATVSMHINDEVPSLAARRPDISMELVAVVERALAKSPSDRFGSGDELSSALADIHRSRVTRSGRLSRIPLRVAVAAGVALVVVIGVSALIAHRSAQDPATSKGGIAIFPFTVRGRVDSTIVTPDGLLELVASRLPGDAGPHALDPQRVIARLREKKSAAPLSTDAMRHLASSLGASTMFVGSATGTNQHLEIAGVIYDVRDGASIAPISVAGAPDNVIALVDQLSAALLVKLVNRATLRTNPLMTSSLPALRRFLGALEQYRRGQYKLAAAELEEALRLDSTFALAALRLAITRNMADGSDGDALTLAQRHANRLTSHEALYLALLTGPNIGRVPSFREEIRSWRDVIDTIPERWEAAWLYADLLLHEGAASDVPDSRSLARNLFERALEADSALAPALEHLLELALIDRDSATVRRIAMRFLTADSAGDNVPIVRWKVAAFEGDSTALRAARAGIRRMSALQLTRVAASSQLLALDAESGFTAAEEGERRATSPSESYFARKQLRGLLLNAGRPSEADRRGPSEAPLTLPVEPFIRTIEALFWDGDTTAVLRSMAVRTKVTEAAMARPDSTDLGMMMDICTAALWNVKRWTPNRIARAIRVLQSFQNPFQAVRSIFIPLCAATLDATLAVRMKRASADVSIERLDSLVRENWPTNGYIRLAARMTLADLLAAKRDYARALRVVRWRSYTANENGIIGLSTLLRAEGKLALQVGDTVGARAAYMQYLALRTRPEPALAEEVDAIRQILPTLVRREP